MSLDMEALSRFSAQAVNYGACGGSGTPLTAQDAAMAASGTKPHIMNLALACWVAGEECDRVYRRYVQQLADVLAVTTDWRPPPSVSSDQSRDEFLRRIACAAGYAFVYRRVCGKCNGTGRQSRSAKECGACNGRKYLVTSANQLREMIAMNRHDWSKSPTLAGSDTWSRRVSELHADLAQELSAMVTRLQRVNKR